MLLEYRLGDFEKGGQIADVFGGRFGLAIEDSGGGYFGAVEVVGDLFEGELFDGFGVEEGCGCGGEGGVLGCLMRVSFSICLWSMDKRRLTSRVARDIVTNWAQV